MTGLVPYVNFREDSTRWSALPMRPVDIVITAPAKAGTTWLQIICALLVFRTADLPASLAELSPWPDSRLTAAEEMAARLQAQRHRRFLKTHVPLDGLPHENGIRYLVGARDPLDIAVSFYHQQRNFDAAKAGLGTPPPLPPLTEWLAAWIRQDADDVRQQVVSLPGVLHHITRSWQRRHHPDVLLVRYADLTTDLPGQMRRIAAHLNITVPEDRWSELVEAATFDRVKQRADRYAPAGPLRDRSAFFRQGTNGSGAAVLGDDDLAAYERRLEQLVPAGLREWLAGVA
jgi:aryl sulfotransferase